MPKLKASPELMDQEPYSSIMNLLEICRQFHPEYKGLTHAHFLYALIDKKKLDTFMSIENQKEMKKYFDKLYFPSLLDRNKPHPKLKSLDNCYFNKNRSSLFQWLLIKGVIKRPQRLNEKLNTLINIGWVDSKGEPKYKRYYSSDKYQRFINTVVINWVINKLNDEKLELFYTIIDSMQFLSIEGLNKLKKTIYQYDMEDIKKDYNNNGVRLG